MRNYLSLVLACMAFGTSRMHSQGPSQSSPAHVKSIQAMLLYSETGKFSKDVLSDSEFVLWNTPSGGGSAEGPSTETLILVEVAAGVDAKPTTSSRLTVTTQVTGKPAIRRQIKYIPFSSLGRHFEGFWLYDTGCDAVTIRAQLNGQPAVQAKLDFHCGE